MSLVNTYTDPVVVCTYALPSIAHQPATVRIRNAGSTSFQVKIQKFETSTAVTAAPVHCVISDEGNYITGGLKYEARKVTSTGTSGYYVPDTWNIGNMEEVTNSVTQTYTSPAIFGQVMTYNDAKASVFWNNSCTNRSNPPYVGSTRMCVGKHIGMINGTRANETLGYFVVESTTTTLRGIKFSVAMGPDTVGGTGNSAPYNYTLNDQYNIGIATQNAEDGGHGSWAVMYGTDPLANSKIGLAAEEENFAGDTTRGHTTENMSYWVFKAPNANIQADKSVSISPLSLSPYAVPGADVIYTFTVENTGVGQVDNNTMLIVDEIPADIVFYNGDIDGPAGPQTGATIWSNTNSGLTFNPATDLKFSNNAARPTDFATDCTYTPTSGYDSNVKYICMRPQGVMNGNGAGVSKFELSFRARVE